MGCARPFWLLAAAASVAVAGCTETKLASHALKEIQQYQQPPDKTASGTYKVGKPYQINGVWYYPSEDYGYDETGVGSWYGPDFHGKPTANGEIFDQNGLTAAHRTLPMPSLVRVTNLENGRSIMVRVNDRGPFAHGRIIDLSRRSAQLLGFERQGTAKVRVQIVPEESRVLAAGFQRPDDTSPPPPAAAPRISVASETLPPPGSPDSPRPIPVSVSAGISQTVRDKAALPDLDKQSVEVMPVKGATQLYVQAGAFALYDNAHRVGARLSPIGPTSITSVTSNGKELFRVRIGPIAKLEDGDRMLEQAIRAGYEDAKLVVD